MKKKKENIHLHIKKKKTRNEFKQKLSPYVHAYIHTYKQTNIHIYTILYILYSIYTYSSYSFLLPPLHTKCNLARSSKMEKKKKKND